MKLTFASSYLSIVDFPPLELPTFTLITGPNGVGKSHLLQAIANGNVKVDHIQPSNQIRLFDWNNFVPQDTGILTSENIKQGRLSLAQQLQQFTAPGSPYRYAEPIRQAAREAGLPAAHLGDLRKLSAFTHDELVSILGDAALAERARDAIQKAVKDTNNSISNHFNRDQSLQLVAIAEEKGIAIVALTDRDVLSSSAPIWGQADLFQQSFAHLFIIYRNMYVENQLAQHQKSKGSKDVDALTDEEFVAKHGPPPWEFVNRSLADAGLDFKIDQPNLLNFDPYQPRLMKNNGVRDINFNTLSSGEKVLMSFAFCVYYAQDRRQLSAYPKLLLLDEVDAPLHPSMSKNIINTVMKTLVDEFGINVIATTHSPSTVALAPEDALYLMKPGQPGLHKTTKSEALNVLTVGVPTLSISYSGRRQVFVESPIDAELYEALYKILKPTLSSERSLEFIATGSKGANGSDNNTGCDILKRLVGELTLSGNSSVFGLVDWDGHHEPSQRIAVLAHGRRNGLENVILDPLLIASVIFRDGGDREEMREIAPDISYLSFMALEPEKLQTYVDRVTTKVLHKEPGQRVVCSYCGGFSLNVDADYLLMDDHKLEAQILAAFPSLNSVARGRSGKLMHHVINRIIIDKPGFIPVEMKEVFDHLLNQPAHTD